MLDQSHSYPDEASEEQEQAPISIQGWALCVSGCHAWYVDPPTKSCRRCGQTERRHRNIHGDSWWKQETSHPLVRLWRRLSLSMVAALGAVVCIALAVAFITAPPPIPCASAIEFSSYRWTPRESLQPAGPGPNYFSCSNVQLDGQGQLHLKVDRLDGQWRSAEVVLTRSLGYGKYTIRLMPLAGPLPDGVTLGILTWDDAPEEFHRELDVAIHRRVVDGNLSSGSFTVQPWDQTGHLHRFGSEPGREWSIDWRPHQVRFEARDAAGAIVESWTFYGPGVPTPGNEKIRVNLWLAKGQPPGDEKPIEVIIEEFAFQPYAEVLKGIR